MSRMPVSGGYGSSIRLFSRNARFYLAGSFISNIVVGAFGAILNLYVMQLGHRADFVGQLVSIQLFAAGFGALPAGLVCNRIGRKKSLVLAAGLICFSTLGMAWLTSTFWLMAFKGLYGFAFAFLSVTVSPFLMENSGSRERAHLFGVNFATHTFAMMIGNVVSGFMVELFAPRLGAIYAYRVTLAFFGVLTAGAAVCYLFIREAREQVTCSPQSEIGREMAETLKFLPVRHLIIYNVLIGFGAGLVVPFFNVFLALKLGASPRTVGAIMALSQVFTGLASLGTPFLVSRFGKIRSVVASQLGSIPFLFMIALPPQIGVVTTSFFLRSALMNMANPITSNLSMEIVPFRMRSLLSSFNRMANDGARSLSAIAAGYLMKEVSLESPYYFTAFIYMLASIHYYFSFRRFDRIEQDGIEPERPGFNVAGTPVPK